MTDKMPERIWIGVNGLGYLTVLSDHVAENYSVKKQSYVRADLVRPAAGEDFDLVEKALEKLATQYDQVLGNNAAITFGRIRNSLVRGNVDVEVQKALDHYDLLIKRAVSTGFCGSDETISARKYLQLLKDHLAANGWLNGDVEVYKKALLAEFERLKAESTTMRDQLYLDAVMAVVENTKPEAP